MLVGCGVIRWRRRMCVFRIVRRSGRLIDRNRLWGLFMMRLVGDGLRRSQRQMRLGRGFMTDEEHELERLRKELEAQRLLNWQLIAADDAGVPLSHASRLRGADLDELREDAKVFAEQLGGVRVNRR